MTFVEQARVFLDRLKADDGDLVQAMSGAASGLDTSLVLNLVRNAVINVAVVFLCTGDTRIRSDELPSLKLETAAPPSSGLVYLPRSTKMYFIGLVEGAELSDEARGQALLAITGAIADMVEDPAQNDRSWVFKPVFVYRMVAASVLSFAPPQSLLAMLTTVLGAKHCMSVASHTATTDDFRGVAAVDLKRCVIAELEGIVGAMEAL